jgi:hypothetical protein
MERGGYRNKTGGRDGYGGGGRSGYGGGGRSGNGGGRGRGREREFYLGADYKPVQKVVDAILDGEGHISKEIEKHQEEIRR